MKQHGVCKSFSTVAGTDKSHAPMETAREEKRDRNWRKTSDEVIKGYSHDIVKLSWSWTDLWVYK